MSSFEESVVAVFDSDGFVEAKGVVEAVGRTTGTGSVCRAGGVGDGVVPTIFAKELEEAAPLIALGAWKTPGRMVTDDNTAPCVTIEGSAAEGVFMPGFADPWTPGVVVEIGAERPGAFWFPGIPGGGVNVSEMAEPELVKVGVPDVPWGVPGVAAEVGREKPEVSWFFRIFEEGTDEEESDLFAPEGDVFKAPFCCVAEAPEVTSGAETFELSLAAFDAVTTVSWVVMFDLTVSVAAGALEEVREVFWAAEGFRGDEALDGAFEEIIVVFWEAEGVCDKKGLDGVVGVPDPVWEAWSRGPETALRVAPELIIDGELANAWLEGSFDVFPGFWVFDVKRVWGVERFRLGECIAEEVGVNWAAELFNGTDDELELVGVFTGFKIAELVVDAAIKTGENELLLGAAEFCWFRAAAGGCETGGDEAIKTNCWDGAELAGWLKNPRLFTCPKEELRTELILSMNSPACWGFINDLSTKGAFCRTFRRSSSQGFAINKPVLSY